MALNTIEEVVCIKCKIKTSIPSIRAIKKCDECHERELVFDLEKNRERSRIGQLKNQRIPELYHKFNPETDAEKLEIGADQFSDICLRGTSVALFGEPGTGKSFLLSQLVRVKHGIYYSAIEIVESLGRDSDIKRYKEIAVLGIDDISKVNPSPARLEKLFEIIDFRHRERRDTVISFDKTLDYMETHFAEPWGRAFADRIRETYYKIILKKRWRTEYEKHR